MGVAGGHPVLSKIMSYSVISLSKLIADFSNTVEAFFHGYAYAFCSIILLCCICPVKSCSSVFQVSGIWLLYKSNTLGDGFLSATLEGFTVMDDREGTQQELRLAIRKPDSFWYSPSEIVTDDEDHHMVDSDFLGSGEMKPVPTMLILDAKFSQYSTSVSLCIQRPQLLVALDFLLAVVEFFVPTVRSMLSNEEDENFSHMVDAVIVEQSTYHQPHAEFSLSPLRPLVVDDERFDHFIYDGKGGTLYLQDRRGLNLSSPSTEAIIYVGCGKKLQFKNVTIKVSLVFFWRSNHLSLCRNLPFFLYINHAELSIIVAEWAVFGFLYFTGIQQQLFSFRG